eukprot:SAG25_NODE_300_length_10170_cov_17.968325_5_plen_115_part_00
MLRVRGATAPPANDSPVDAVARRGATSDGSSSSDERSEEEQGGTDDEELLITEIVSHRDTDRLGVLHGALRGADDGVEVLTAVSPHELWLVARHVAFAVVVQHTFAGRIDGRHR